MKRYLILKWTGDAWAFASGPHETHEAAETEIVAMARAAFQQSLSIASARDIIDLHTVVETEWPS